MKIKRVTNQEIREMRKRHNEWVEKEKNRENYILVKKIALSLLKRYYKQN